MWGVLLLLPHSKTYRVLGKGYGRTHAEPPLASREESHTLLVASRAAVARGAACAAHSAIR